MSKIKNPLLSLGAKGTVADTITYTRRRKTNIVMEKPVPTDPQTLAQIYQRWHYQDYAYLWTQQSHATRQSYQTLGSRQHLTGFQYWMKVHLNILPDLALLLHLDERTGSFAQDFSKKGNHGTIFGALHVPGYIDYCLSFDTVDDSVLVKDDPSLKPLTALTLETWINVATLDGSWDSIGAFKGEDYELYLYANVLQGYLRLTSGFLSLNTGITPTLGEWYHFVLTFDSTLPSNQGKLFLNSLLKAQGTGAGTIDYRADVNFAVGAIPPWANSFGGLIDEWRTYNRALSQEEITRHYVRRYS